MAGNAIGWVQNLAPGPLATDTVTVVAAGEEFFVQLSLCQYYDDFATKRITISVKM